MGYSINSCKKIVFKKENLSPIEIKEVWYCDYTGNSHKIWPCIAELREVYVVALSTNGQSYDTSSIQYMVDQNNIPNVTLLPGYKYAVKGTIYIYDSEMNRVDTITDCYFHYETTEHTNLSGTGFYTTTDNSLDISSTFGNRTDSNGISNTYYSYWSCTTDVGTDRGMTMQAYYDTDTYGPVQFNYVYDPNYVTPFVFRRAEITETYEFWDLLAQDSVFNSITLNNNTQKTLWVKHTKSAVATGWSNNNWEQSEINGVVTSAVSNNPSLCSVVVNQNGSFTISTGSGYGQAEITINGNNNIKLYVEVGEPVSYSVEYKKESSNTWSALPSTLNIGENIQLRVKEIRGSTETVYSGNWTVNSSNTNAIQEVNKTLIPNMSNLNANSTITVNVDNSTVGVCTMTVVEQPTYFRAGINDANFNHNTVQVLGNNTITWNNPGVNQFKIAFATDSNMTNSRSVVIEVEQLIEPDGLELTIDDSYGTYILLEVDPTSTSGTYSREIYINDTSNNPIGTITLTVNV